MSIIIFTSITANYLPKARVLAQSVKKHHPEVIFSLLLAETAPLEMTADFTDFDEVTLLNDLPIPDLPAWLFKHSVVEACTAIKGFYLEQLLERDNCDAVFYLDPDIVVFSPLTLLFEQLEHASILLTPHLLEAEEKEEDIIINELSALKHGVYNLGFLGIKNTQEGKKFASWWKARLSHFCYADIPSGMFTDQRWVDLAPAFFSDLAIIRHPGCNVATWNLNRRHLEGSFEQGFTVNAKPLIFYHFSGFDSGAQLGMLNRYASNMPAAFLLREWYINACLERETEAMKPSWSYNYFSNGTIITQAHRQFYREHPAIAACFPNPFEAGEQRFLDWYDFYSPYYHASPLPDFGHNPLAHFLNNGWKLGLEPHPAFNSRFYLEHNKDVLEQHINPLFHYLHTGGKEKRNPHPFFDTGFYLRRYKKQVKASGTTPLQYALSHEEHAISLHCYDAKVDAARLCQFDANIRKTLPTILLITHNQGGGTEKHVYELAQIMEGKANFLLLYPVTTHVLRLANFSLEQSVDLLFDWRTQLEMLVTILQHLGVGRLHIHHVMGNSPYLALFIDYMALPYDLTLHDYYLLSPHPHLTDDEGRFSGEAAFHPEWQQQNRWLIEGSSRIIAPSMDIAARHRRYFPEGNYVIAPHPSLHPYDPSHVSVPPLKPDEPLRIAVLGLVSPNKGSAVLDKTAQLAHAMNAPLTFDLIGSTLTPLEVSPASTLTVHGAYEEEDLPALLASLNPHLVWFPALCPESFSYTLSSAMAAALPVVVPNIGAFGERVAHRPWSWVRAWDSAAGEWVTFFTAIRAQHFLPSHPPERGEEKTYMSDTRFYEERYISSDHS